jgi:5-methylcytosine-specific restriction protein A
MAVRRSTEMWLVAYFLSRCGQRRPGGRMPGPPPQLQASSWEEAYALFFPRLHGGRSFPVFHHSMKNARDMFDGHLDSGRVGWRENEVERPPQALNPDAQGIMDEWQKVRSDDALWEAVKQHADFRARGLSVADLEGLVSSPVPAGQA